LINDRVTIISANAASLLCSALLFFIISSKANYYRPKPSPYQDEEIRVYNPKTCLFTPLATS